MTLSLKTLSSLNPHYYQTKREPQGAQWNIRTGPSGKNILNFSFKNGTFWRTSNFWVMVGPPNVAGPGVTYLPYAPPLDWPGYYWRQIARVAHCWVNVTAVPIVQKLRLFNSGNVKKSPSIHFQMHSNSNIIHFCV